VLNLGLLYDTAASTLPAMPGTSSEEGMLSAVFPSLGDRLRPPEDQPGAGTSDQVVAVSGGS
jgi:hypothetical protein